MGAQQALHTRGLSFYTLKPEGLEGIPLLDHMCRMARREVSGTGRNAQWKPSAALDIAMTAAQQNIWNPTPQDYAAHALLLDAGGDGARQKLPQRRLNVLGTIGAHSMIANSEERMASMQNTLNLAASMAQIKRVTEAAQKKKGGE